jgi:hypothetical protein
MPRRRLEDRIRELCARASEPDWRSVLAELRIAIHEHALKMSNLTMAAVVGGHPHIIRERRGREPRLNASFMPLLCGPVDDSPNYSPVEEMTSDLASIP